MNLGLRVVSPLSAEVERIVRRVMDSTFRVHRELGPGFKERIYQRALCLELDAAGLKFETEKQIDVKYRHWTIPGQRIDLIVEERVLVEVKAVPRLGALHKRQVVSYLKTLDLEIGLLVNFNSVLLKDGFRRVIR